MLVRAGDGHGRGVGGTHVGTEVVVQDDAGEESAGEDVMEAPEEE